MQKRNIRIAQEVWRDTAENILCEQFRKKRVWVKPGMRPFQIHINEKIILTLEKILGRDATASELNRALNQIQYGRKTIELAWARPMDKSYGKLRPIVTSKGLCLTIFC